MGRDMKVAALKDEFLDSQALQSSLRAALQHNKLYEREKDMPAICKDRGTVFNKADYDKTKGQFRKEWKRLLQKNGQKYQEQAIEVSFDEYFKDLLNIQQQMQAYIKSLDAIKQKYFLGFKFSHAQKSFSLYLKYRWCHGKFKEPPFLPLDREILNRLNRRSEDRNTIQVPWTKIDPEDLKKCGDMKTPTLGWAEWELGQWNKIFTDDVEDKNGEEQGS